MKLSKQQATPDVRKFSYSQRVVQEGKKLPQEVVDATSANQFENRLDKLRRRCDQQKLGLTSPSLEGQVQVHCNLPENCLIGH